ncbi:MMPL family transporter [Xanthomonas hortorum]|uniref:Membrane transport protein MMPL domain-containing protein n=1 Tax=Xanthomonas hortorum pv. pelargonii TaxID=453602 RepID=A0A6V7F1Y0_9XANT|nr:MMPL family transporter [Xanthomonas hortorum]MCE4352965.1 MMPL family transporter [Xanthomonas hortorum pv. pelargonii]MCM5525752.1 MMPL family transporter [Xanthomonas hortorum pv. pelargonii]MCM5538103.1 MMPL family transporter [Xanthomonas hortorum pv. pelargonii]MCM5542277.1 MMPL family transporter [Xanthomonas hortorum pv. pelargonii]MCM5545893.1 MMPL family transporter [Xanthomonas hortorum pv. pelargonii]
MALKLNANRRIGLALLWLALLAVAGFWLSETLKVTGDLRKFMPAPRTPAQKLLIEELGEGPGSRLLLMSLSNSDTATLAAQSQALQQALAAQPELFELVGNGGNAGLDAIPERLLPYRYLLSDSFDKTPLDGQTLQAALQARVQDLGSPAAAMVEPLLPRDPTLEILHLAETLQPAAAPQTRNEVWFDRAGTSALLIVQTRAAGFDPTGQQLAYDAVQAAFAKVSKGTSTTLVLTGPGAFAVEITARTQGEAQWIGTLDTVGLVLLLLVAYRSWKIPVLGVLPLASAGLAGLGAVALLFDGVHGITVAFGFTLIGVVQDYPIHLFSHQRPGLDPRDNARHLWPTLATGVVSTCIAYVTFLFSGVDGLRQLAVFTIAGLATAAITTRWLLPSLIDPAPRDYADSRMLAALWRGIARLPRPRISLAVIAVIGIAVIVFAPGQFWQNDLSKLTPVPPKALAQDTQLRQELGAPDVRYVLALPAANDEAALQASEQLRPRLEALVREGTLTGYDMAARYLPSAKTQRARQAALPDAAQARALTDSAVAATPFRSDAFAPFLQDLDAAKQVAPLLPKDLAGSPLATSVGGLLLGHGDRSTALVSLTGLRDPAVLAAAVQGSGAQLLDLKDASESLVAAYRGRVLGALVLAALLLAVTVAIALRSPRRIVRVLLPMALTTVLILAILRGMGVELNLFHLIALILAAGLGLDYALFFDHAGDDHADQLRTLHALIVCSLMTLLVFALLAASSIPVLRAIGSTVALGVLFNFILALLVSREPALERTKNGEPHAGT